MNAQDIHYLKLLAREYPSPQAASAEIINLTAILNLPKGTEHFMSDIHGEHEAFLHILNNGSGAVADKIDQAFEGSLVISERRALAALIYYPREKLIEAKATVADLYDWYCVMLRRLIAVCRLSASKYSRSKVRKALPREFAYIMEELLNTAPNRNQDRYYDNIIRAIIDTGSADTFIVEIATLIKRMTVDVLHIVGDIFDRGENADKILDLLMKYHSLDLEWGNHDILWMGAACGSDACIASVVRNNIKYSCIETLENGYGISLRSLTLFAEKTYPDLPPMEAALKAISVILFKLEGQIIMRRPEYEMEGRLLLDKINYENGTIESEGTVYQMKDTFFPTVDPTNAYVLSEAEQEVMDNLRFAFVNSHRLHEHVKFLYDKGCMYKCYNGNLLYHGCIPLDEEGNFDGVKFGGCIYTGKSYLDYAEKIARKAWSAQASQWDLDFMWYLWCGRKSPLSGRNVKTFERTFIADKEAWHEETNPYYKHYYSEKTCNMILREFHLYSDISHIINGHTPVKTEKGEKPVRANGKLIVIDGGFSKAYHKTTGIAGYTLIYNSHGMRIKAHQPFESVEKVLEENKDMESTSKMFETEPHRLLVGDTDDGKKIKEDIQVLTHLLESYKKGKKELF